MARTFTYHLSELGRTHKVMIHYGAQRGQYSDEPRFTMEPADGTARVRCYQTDEPVPLGKFVVVDAERRLTYCAHCANGQAGGQITEVRIDPRT